MKNASDVLLVIEGTKITGETTNSLNLITDMIETTHKHSTGKAKTYIGGEHGGTISVSGAADPNNTTDWGYVDAYTAKQDRTVIVFKVGDVGTVGADIITGNALISSLTKDNPQNDRSTFTVELQITGPTEKVAGSGCPTCPTA